MLGYDNPHGKALPTSSIVRQRESRRSREYVKAYSKGACVTNVDSVRDKIKLGRKCYKQHRVPSQRGCRDVTVTSVVREYRCGICNLVGHRRTNCPNR